MKKNTSLFIVAAICCFSCSRPEPQTEDILLSDGWLIQAESKVDQEWYKASVPCTVMGALTSENGLYNDLFVGKNYADIDKEQFEEPWFYKTTFETPALKEGQRVELAFDGISYRADIWLNGQQIASSEEHFGPFRQFSYDVTDVIAERNELTVKVYRWQKGEFNIGFVDWNPRPADESMGIFRPV